MTRVRTPHSHRLLATPPSRWTSKPVPRDGLTRWPSSALGTCNEILFVPGELGQPLVACHQPPPDRRPRAPSVRRRSAPRPVQRLMRRSQKRGEARNPAASAPGRARSRSTVSPSRRRRSDRARVSATGSTGHCPFRLLASRQEDPVGDVFRAGTGRAASWTSTEPFAPRIAGQSRGGRHGRTPAASPRPRRLARSPNAISSALGLAPPRSARRHATTMRPTAGHETAAPRAARSSTGTGRRAGGTA